MNDQIIDEQKNDAQKSKIFKSILNDEDKKSSLRIKRKIEQPIDRIPTKKQKKNNIQIFDSSDGYSKSNSPIDLRFENQSPNEIVLKRSGLDLSLKKKTSISKINFKTQESIKTDQLNDDLLFNLYNLNSNQLNQTFHSNEESFNNVSNHFINYNHNINLLLNNSINLGHLTSDQFLLNAFLLNKILSGQ